MKIRTPQGVSQAFAPRDDKYEWRDGQLYRKEPIMTRPIDETWRVYNGPAGRDDVALEGTRDVILESVGPCDGFGKEAEARVRLASQAPAMARLLLELEFCATDSHFGDVTDSICPVCRGDANPDLATPKRHTPDCALIAVLRAAGVAE